MSYFDDVGFQKRLCALVVRDRQFLMKTAHLLTGADFRPQSGAENKSGFRERWIIAERALDYWNKYREPINDLILHEVKKHAKLVRMSDEKQDGLTQTARKILGLKIHGVGSITDSVIEYKKERLKAKAVQELIQLQAEGSLTDERWMDICRDAIRVFEADPFVSQDYFQSLEGRILRRSNRSTRRFPALFIDQLDVDIRCIARGHLGLILAPFKRGKSMMLIWIALAYAVQGLNVLYITLEDPREDVEDRFDAAVSSLHLKKLSDKKDVLRKRFSQFRRFIRTRLEIIDGTDRSFTVRTIEQAFDDKRQQGWTPDAVIIDYDDEIKVAKKLPERRMEFAEVYRQLRQFASQQQILVWTAAQTIRKSEGVKVLSADYLAEDISKARKVSCALALGRGDWGEDSIYIYVAAHRNDKQHVGYNMFADKARMTIYDRERTVKKLRAEALKKHMANKKKGRVV